MAEKVFVDVAQDVFGVEALVLKGDFGNQVDQANEALLRQLELGVVLVEDPFELGVFLFDFGEGVVDEFSNGGDFVGRLLAVDDFDFCPGSEGRVFLNRFPAGQGRHPEDIFFNIIVAHFQFLMNCLFILTFRFIVSRIEKVVVVFVPQLGFNFPLSQFKSVGNVLQKYQSQNSVLINGCIEI